MSTPPIGRKRSYVSTPENQDPIMSTPNNPPSIVSSNGTHILQDPDRTHIIGEYTKSSIFEGPGEKLGKEFDDASTEVDDKVKHLETYLNYRKKRYREDQEARVEETKKMSFGLPAKKGGRRSKKSQRKHRKKTSKRKSRK